MAVNAVPVQAPAKTASDLSGQKTGRDGGFSSIMNSVLPSFATALNGGSHLQALTGKAMTRPAAASPGAEKAPQRQAAATPPSAPPQRAKESGAVSNRDERQQNSNNIVEKPAKDDEPVSTKDVRPKPDESGLNADVGQTQPPPVEKDNSEKVATVKPETGSESAALAAGAVGGIERDAAPTKNSLPSNAPASNAKPTEASTPANIAPGDDAPELTEAAKAAIEQAKTAAPNDQLAKSAVQKTDAISQQSAGLIRAAGDQPVAISVETKTEPVRTSGTPIPAQSASNLSPDATVTASAANQAGTQGGGTTTQDGNRSFSSSTGEQSGQNQGQTAADSARAASQQAANVASVTATIANRAAVVANNAQPAFSETLTNAAATTTLTPGAAASIDAAGAGAGLTSLARPLPGVAQAAAANVRNAILPHTMEQIKVQIGKGLADGQDTIKMQLHPSELGRIEIRLEMRNGQVSASIIADRQETLQLLKNDSQALQQSLQDAGLDANKNSLSFQLRGDNEQPERQNAENGSEGENRGIDIAEDAVQPKMAETVSDGVVNITV